MVQIIKIKKRRDFWFCKTKRERERERDKKKGRENYFQNVSNKKKKAFFSKFMALNFTTKEKSDKNWSSKKKKKKKKGEKKKEKEKFWNFFLKGAFNKN